MSDHERTLGRVEEGIEWIKKELLMLRSEVNALNRFRFKIIGGSVLVSAIVSILIGVLGR